MGTSADEEQNMTSSVSDVAGVPSGHRGKGILAQLTPSSSRQTNPMMINIFGSYVNLLVAAR